jgi:predicted ribosomally synthesized peptide with SipW-like signal peptide
MQKNLIRSSFMLLAVLATVVGGTVSFFSDTEVSSGNVFTAGSIDLRIDHARATYNGEVCENDCEEGGADLIQNGSFEDPALGNGQWQIYPTGITGWTVESGPGIEVQRNAAGAPHSGNQHVELDSTASTVMSQTILTTPGQKYRLTFWYSPRPNRPAGDNIIGFEVEVVSGSETILAGQVGVGQAGGGTTNWTKYTYDFIAVDGSTKILFSDDGTSNTFGGYLDTVSVRTLTCTEGTYVNTLGGMCQLWDATDLTTEAFFDFADVKPQDSGSNLISLHVDSNEAFLCLNVGNVEDEENTLVNPEQVAGDNSTSAGELGSFLTVAAWYSNENGVKGDVLFPPTKAADLETITFADGTSVQDPIAPGTPEYIYVEWCLGEFVGGVCDGAIAGINQTQTDSFMADLQFYAVQTRNNESFSCGAVDFPEDEEGENETVVVAVTNESLNESLNDFATQALAWFFFNDDTNTVMPLNEFGGGVNEITVGPEGVGAAKMVLHDAGGRYNIASNLFGGTPLSSISTLRYRVYDASASNEKPYLHFNVDFNNSGTFQNRLVMVPNAGGNLGMNVGEWTTVDAINSGDALWCWSGMPPCGGSATAWPTQTGTAFANPAAPYQTWDDILAAYPGITMNANVLAFLGVRVGHPGPNGEESYVDWIEVDGVRYDFE